MEAVVSSPLLKLLPAAALLGLAAPSAALDEIVRSRGWTQVDYAQSGRCRAEVRGNGQFYRIAGAGMEPGERVRVVLRNEDLRPVQYRLVANDDGMWREFYVPFVWHLEGGVVQVDVEGSRCRLDLAFVWQRRRL
jgi:hypothetical protein